MALLFQYGSNMSVSRLNGDDRLAGDAKVLCIAQTIERFEFGFTVFSKSNNCAAADIVSSESGRNIYGVLYEVPDYLLSKQSANARDRRSMDEIEAEGVNYVRAMIDLTKDDGSRVQALTYLVKSREAGLKTSYAYVSHILRGLMEHDMPENYRQYVKARILENNDELRDALLKE
jgi:cation transport regulator ChaC